MIVHPDPHQTRVRPAPPPRLAAVATALPPHVCAQGDIRRFAQALLEPSLGPDERRLFTVFESTGIERRHFAMPLDWFASPRGSLLPHGHIRLST